jgi:hypothetical protein
VEQNWKLINTHFHGTMVQCSAVPSSYGSAQPTGEYIGQVCSVIPFWKDDALMQAHICYFAIVAMDAIVAIGAIDALVAIGASIVAIKLSTHSLLPPLPCCRDQKFDIDTIDAPLMPLLPLPPLSPLMPHVSSLLP